MVRGGQQLTLHAAPLGNAVPSAARACTRAASPATADDQGLGLLVAPRRTVDRPAAGLGGAHGHALPGLGTGECLRQSNLDGNGGDIDPTHPVRVGSHAIDHSYSQLYAWGPSEVFQHVNVSIEYSVGKRDNSGSERELDVLVTPIAVVRSATESDSEAEPESQANFAVVFAGSFAWGRVGTVSVDPSAREISLQGHRLEPVQLRATAAVLPKPVCGAVPPGLLGGQACQFGSKACGSQSCTQSAGGDIACSSGVCLTPPGEPWAVGNCTAPQQLPHLALSLGAGPVGLTTRRGSDGNASAATLTSIQARVAAALAVQRRHEQRFGSEHAELA